MAVKAVEPSSLDASELARPCCWRDCRLAGSLPLAPTPCAGRCAGPLSPQRRSSFALLVQQGLCDVRDAHCRSISRAVLALVAKVVFKLLVRALLCSLPFGSLLSRLLLSRLSSLDAHGSLARPGLRECCCRRIARKAGNLPAASCR